jgi:hypothetical protein
MVCLTLSSQYLVDVDVLVFCHNVNISDIYSLFNSRLLDER